MVNRYKMRKIPHKEKYTVTDTQTGFKKMKAGTEKNAIIQTTMLNNIERKIKKPMKIAGMEYNAWLKMFDELEKYSKQKKEKKK